MSPGHSLLRSSVVHPSYSGVWSLTPDYLGPIPSGWCLNPSYSGVWSLTIDAIHEAEMGVYVLILLIVEYGL